MELLEDLGPNRPVGWHGPRPRVLGEDSVAEQGQPPLICWGLGTLFVLLIPHTCHVSYQPDELLGWQMGFLSPFSILSPTHLTPGGLELLIQACKSQLLPIQESCELVVKPGHH